MITQDTINSITAVYINNTTTTYSFNILKKQVLISIVYCRCYVGDGDNMEERNCIQDDFLSVPEWKKKDSLPDDYLSLT